MVTSSSTVGGQPGGYDVQDAGWNLCVDELCETTMFWPLTGADDGDVSYVHEAIIEVELQAPSANIRGKS
jgi:hypothetical protein